MVQFLGFGDFQSGFPVAKSNATSRAVPAGAMIALPFSIRGHCPAYHSGIVVPY